MMKTYKLIMAGLFMMFLAINYAYTQQQMYAVHEDRVHANMVDEYEQAAKGLVAQLKKHDMEGPNYLAVQTNDFTYMYLSPIDNFADLDENPMADLNEKMGEDASNVWGAFEGCYDEHGDYVITLDHELSYQPGGIDPNPEGEHYRVLDYWYVSDGNADKLAEVAKKIKALYERIGSDFYYRVYRGGFGTMGPLFMVASAAENPQKWHEMAQKTVEKGGEERKKLVQEALNLTRKYESKTAWIRPDLSYSSGM